MFGGLDLFSSNVIPPHMRCSESAKVKLRPKTLFHLQGKVFPYTVPILHVYSLKQKLYFKINILPNF